jgi:hypothetical protein
LEEYVLKHALLFVVLAIGVPGFLSAQALTEPPGGVPQTKLADIEKTGEKIFALDRAASLATDAVGKLKGFKRDKRLEGWITEETGDGVQVSFVGSKGKAPASVLYRVTISAAGGIVNAPEAMQEPVALTEEQTRQFAARALGLESVEAPCSKRYNTVVLPRASPDANWVVYALPGTKKAGVYPVGGSYRFEVAPDGDSVILSRGYAKTCIELTRQANLAAFTLSHLLDPNPTEIHVFVNLLSETPIYVLTADNKAMWSVERGKIKFIQTMGEKG